MARGASVVGGHDCTPVEMVALVVLIEKRSFVYAVVVVENVAWPMPPHSRNSSSPHLILLMEVLAEDMLKKPVMDRAD